MALRVHLIVGSHHDALRVDQVRDAHGIRCFVAIGCTIGDGEFVRGVAEQQERKRELLGERTIVGHRVEAGTKDDDVGVLKIEDSIPESLTLDASARGISLGIEPQHHVLAALIA